MSFWGEENVMFENESQALGKAKPMGRFFKLKKKKGGTWRRRLSSFGSVASNTTSPRNRGVSFTSSIDGEACSVDFMEENSALRRPSVGLPDEWRTHADLPSAVAQPLPASEGILPLPPPVRATPCDEQDNDNDPPPNHPPIRRRRRHPAEEGDDLIRERVATSVDGGEKFSMGEYLESLQQEDDLFKAKQQKRQQQRKELLLQQQQQLQQYVQKEQSRPSDAATDTVTTIEVKGVHYRNGDVYSGGCTMNGLQHGFGEYVHANGDRYKGDWVDGKACGQCTLAYSDGRLYKGQVLDYEQEGEGHMVFADGAKFTGSWKAGQKHGRGAQEMADGSRYEGAWKANRRHGRGVFCNGRGLTYEGGWVADRPHGKGQFRTQDGARYAGFLSKGFPQGEGTMSLPDGRRYDGQWSHGVPHGFGVLHDPYGATFTGEWEQGKPSAGGSLTAGTAIPMYGGSRQASFQQQGGGGGGGEEEDDDDEEEEERHDRLVDLESTDESSNASSSVSSHAQPELTDVIRYMRQPVLQQEQEQQQEEEDEEEEREERGERLGDTEIKDEGNRVAPLLTDVIRYPLMRQPLLRYCDRLFKTENIYFVLRVDTLRSWRGSRSSLEEAIGHVLNDFVLVGSPNEINIEYLMRKTLIDSIEAQRDDVWAFDEAYVEVQKIMKHDIWHGFRNSPEWAEVLRVSADGLPAGFGDPEGGGEQFRVRGVMDFGNFTASS